MNWTEWLPTCAAQPPTTTTTETWCWLHSEGPPTLLPVPEDVILYCPDTQPNVFWEFTKLLIGCVFGIVMLFALVRAVFGILDRFAPEGDKIDGQEVGMNADTTED